jgi:hypothetical protein
MSLSAQAPKPWKPAPHAGPAVPHSHADAIVIGGGASGVLMAFHLLRDTPSDFRVTLIEKSPRIGRGIAYATANIEHLLNARIAFMSALRDEPDHFRQWLCAHPDNASADRQDTIDPSGFAPRPVYGDYLQSLIEPFVAPARGQARLHVVCGECCAIDENRSGVDATLADGSRHTADIAILATGHDVRPKSGGCYVDPWTPPAEPAVKRDARVLIVGTGLTMVDYVLSLEAAGHQGPIIAMSRHGLLPRRERKHDMLAIHPADIPFGAGPADLLRWQRNLVEKHLAEGGDWRGVIDGVPEETGGAGLVCSCPPFITICAPLSSTPGSIPKYQLISPMMTMAPRPRPPAPPGMPPRDALASRSSSTLSLGRKSSVRIRHSPFAIRMSATFWRPFAVSQNSIGIHPFNPVFPGIFCLVRACFN